MPTGVSSATRLPQEARPHLRNRRFVLGVVSAGSSPHGNSGERNDRGTWEDHRVTGHSILPNGPRVTPRRRSRALPHSFSGVALRVCRLRFASPPPKQRCSERQGCSAGRCPTWVWRLARLLLSLRCSCSFLQLAV